MLVPVGLGTLPMEPAQGPSRDELEKALADHKLDDLKEMARRLNKSHESLNEMLEELQAEKQGLESENTDLQQTIDRFMKELQKLNIGAGNTVEPRLAEDPMIFANRMWEKLKPRDSGVVVSEHVGEIKKPVMDEDGSPVNDNQEKVRQVVENVQNAIGPLWQRGLGAWGNLQQKFNERTAPAPKPKPQRKKKEAGYQADGQRAPQAAAVPAEAPAPVPAEAPAQAVVVGQLAKPVSSDAASSSSPAADAVAEAQAPEPAPAPEPALAPESAAAEAAAEEEQQEAVEDQISSTVLIEAELTLDDGSVQILQVRAADRCKEVANRFIQEHSLKAWFKEPLTKWLKEIENDAVKFPVKAQGDLLEIRKNYAKV